jgi:O-antigen/teichoic acid export membrane protein
VTSNNPPSETTSKAGNDSVAASSGLLLAARLVTNSGYFVAVVLIAHALHPAGRGGVAFITVTALLIAAASLIGLDNATMVYAARNESLRATLLANLLTVGTIMPVVVGGVVCLALFAFPQVRPGNVLPIDLAILLVGSVATSIGNCGSAYLVGCRRFRAKALSDLVMPWGYASLLLVIYSLSHMTVTRAVTAWTVAQLLQAAIYCASSLSIAGIRRPSWSLLHESIAFGARSWAGSISAFLNARVDQTIMGLISSEQSLGIYAVAVNASEIVLYLPGAVAVALIPAIAASPPKDRLFQTLRIARIVLMLTLVSVIMAALAGWFLIPPVFGDAYRGSVGPFLWLLPGALGYASLRIFNSALLASDSPTRASIGPTAALATGVAFDLILIPMYGATGAAIAATLAFFAGGLTAVAAHRGRSRYHLGQLVPKRDDARFIKGLATRAAISASSLARRLRPKSLFR